MTSQISIRKLLKQELKQNAWMLGLTGLLHLLTGPVVFLLSTSNYSAWDVDTATKRYLNFFTDSYPIWQLLTMLVCLLVNIFIYRYLFSRRMVDLYHSVPISRDRLFLTKYLHGFLVWFIPFMFNIGSIFLFLIIRCAGKSYLLPCIGIICKTIGLLLLSYFIFYHLFLAALYISGNVLNMFTNMILMGSSVIGTYLALFVWAESFDTFCYEPTNLTMDILFGLSPITTPFAIYGFFMDESLIKHLPLLILSVVVCILLLYLSWRLYRNRPSELAENGTKAKLYIIPARMIGTIMAGMAGALFFSSISSGDSELGWGIFGALLTSVVTFGFINSIYKTSIKYFFKHKIQMFVSAVISILIVLIFQLDLIGYDAYIPDKDKIAGISIYSNTFSDGSSYIDFNLNSYTPPTLSSSNENGYVKQDTFLTDKDLCYDLLDTFVNSSGTGYTYFYTKIQLENGYTYERRYRICDQDYEKLKPFIESNDYIETNYKYSSGMFGYPSNMTLEFRHTYMDLYPSQNALAKQSIERIMDAYWLDFKENYSLKNLSSRITIFNFSGDYVVDGINRYYSLEVPINYENTLNVVKELYPEIMITIDSPEQILMLDIDSNYYSKVSTTDTTLSSLYRYFGYESAELEMNPEITSDSTVVGNEAVTTMPTIETYFAVSITDPYMLEELFPLLYFGNYRDVFDQKEYIHLGYAQTINGNSVSCYVKPGTLPEEIIELIYISQKTYEY